MQEVLTDAAAVSTAGSFFQFIADRWIGYLLVALAVAALCILRFKKKELYQKLESWGLIFITAVAVFGGLVGKFIWILLIGLLVYLLITIFRRRTARARSNFLRKDCSPVNGRK